MDIKKAPDGAFFIYQYLKKDSDSEKLFTLFISFFILFLFLSKFFSKT